MNHLKHHLFWFIGTLFGILLIVPSHAESLAEVTLLNESAQSLTLELTIPEPVISEKHLSGSVYQAIQIAGTGYTHDPGKPQLPIRGTLIAIPDGSQLQLEILGSDTEILSGILLPPAPELKSDNDTTIYIYNKQAEIYQSDSDQPASPVKIGMIGYLGEQRVAQIQFFPVLHNPVQQTIKLYKRLRVRVSFSNDTRSAPVMEESSPFDRMLDSLLINPATRQRRSRTTRDTTCPPPLPALKISIDKTGVYAISYADFLALGLDLSVLDAQQIHMSHQGEPVSIFIAGVEDGVFGPGDALFFYAQAADGLYTRNNVYWLSLNPDGGARLNFKEGTPAPSLPQLTEFTQTVHVENNNLYSSRMPDSTNRDHLFWKQVGAGDSLDMPVTLHHVAQTSGNATVRVMLQGQTDNPAINPDHHTKILLNGVEIHDALWNGQAVFLQEITFDQAKLLDGVNTISLVSDEVTGVTANIVYVNWLEVDYVATMSAVQDHLIFDVTGSGLYNLIVSDFTQPDLLVLDVTDPLQIVPMLGATVSADGTGGFQVQYTDQLDGSKMYYAFSFAKILKPAIIDVDLPTKRLKSPCNRADYFVIYHDSFDINALEGVVAARGVEVMAVPVSDIYDEFSHGLPSPQAIKDFLIYAYENYTAPRPSYVLLVGDANRDTLNDLGHGINYIPTYTFHTREMGETPTDNWFVSVSGEDSLPDMFLGRVPVRTQAELDAVVNKLFRYPLVPLDGWQREVLLVTDNVRDFEATSDRLIEQYLADYVPKRVYLGEYAEGDVDAVTQDIVDAIDAGAVLTNYIGHGSLNLWAGEIIFNFEDVGLLDNADKLTFVVALDCQNGWFSYSQPFRGTSDSFAEVFLKADGKGAIGMFAPSGLGYSTEHEVLAGELFGRLFRENVTELGFLTTAAKIAAVSNYGISKDNLEMFTLFGDPGLRLRLE